MLRRSIGIISRQAFRRSAGEEAVCLLNCRNFHSRSPQSATYRRFGERSQERPAAAGLPSLGGQNPIVQQLVNRLGGGRNGGQGGKNGKKGNASSSVFVVVIGSGGVYYVYHLEKVPATGRRRFLDISRKQELQIGIDTTQQTMQEFKSKILPNNDPRVKFVRQTAQRIINALHDSDYASDHLNTGTAAESMQSNDTRNQHATNDSDVKWEVFVIDDPNTPNAFVTSNGKIFVYTGILPICQDQDGLATVLGHEIAHQLARHVAEKVSGTKVIMFGSFLLDAFGLDIGISRIALTFLLSLPNSRKVETEADEIGLQLMSRACFDPSKAPSLWERMETVEGGKGKGGSAILDTFKTIMSTHPLSKKRMEALQTQVPRALDTRRQAGCQENIDVGAFQSASRSQYSL